MIPLLSIPICPNVFKTLLLLNPKYFWSPAPKLRVGVYEFPSFSKVQLAPLGYDRLVGSTLGKGYTLIWKP